VLEEGCDKKNENEENIIGKKSKIKVVKRKE